MFQVYTDPWAPDIEAEILNLAWYFFYINKLDPDICWQHRNTNAEVISMWDRMTLFVYHEIRAQSARNDRRDFNPNNFWIEWDNVDEALGEG